MRMLVKDWGVFQDKKKTEERSKGKILEENLFQFQFQFTFQQNNNLKHKAKYTLLLLTKMTLNVPEGPT